MNTMRFNTTRSRQLGALGVMLAIGGLFLAGARAQQPPSKSSSAPKAKAAEKSSGGFESGGRALHIVELLKMRLLVRICRTQLTQLIGNLNAERSEFGNIQPDERTNRLLGICTEEDFRRGKEAIKALDVDRPVGMNSDAERGVLFFASLCASLRTRTLEASLKLLLPDPNAGRFIIDNEHAKSYSLPACLEQSKSLKPSWEGSDNEAANWLKVSACLLRMNRCVPA